MKIKAILVALALSGASAFAQGLVTFQNSTFTTPIKVDFDGDGPGAAANIAGGGDFSFYFIYGLSSDNVNNTSATYLSGNAGRITTTGTANISLAVAGAQPVFFQMFGYLTSAGSYQAAFDSGVAPVYQSDVIQVVPSVAPSPGAPLFGTTPGTSFQGFTLVPVPEPSTIALGILGAGSLLFLRRKK